MTRPAAVAVTRPAAVAVTRPAAVAVAAATAAAFVGLVDPDEPGHYPTCPFLAVTGLFCPGCGSLRAVHALTRADLATAVDRNLLAVLALPFVVAGWAAWTVRAARGRPPALVVPAGLIWALAVLVIGYSVLRNLPVGAWLAP